MTTIIHNTVKYSNKEYQGQTKKVGGLSKSERRQRAINETELVFLSLARKIDKRETQREDRRAKRNK